MEELAFLSGQREHRNKGQQDDRHGKEDGTADQCVDSRTVSQIRCGRCVSTSLLQVAEGVLGHDDAGVDQHANRDGDAGEAHDVRRDAGVVHHKERAQDGERQRERDDQDAAEVHQEDDVRQRDQQDLLDQRAPQRVDRPARSTRSDRRTARSRRPAAGLAQSRDARLHSHRSPASCSRRCAQPRRRRRLPLRPSRATATRNASPICTSDILRRRSASRLEATTMSADVVETR